MEVAVAAEEHSFVDTESSVWIPPHFVEWTRRH